MVLLARALRELELADVVTFATSADDVGGVGVTLRTRALWRPWWRRNRGRAVDRMLPAVDVVHVAGVATPPTRTTPLFISVDYLRPLRDDARGRQRVAQLRRAVDRGAQLVASSRTASLEVQRALGLQRDQVVAVAPAVAFDRTVIGGADLVVNVTGRTDDFLARAPGLVALARRRGARVVVLASTEASVRIRQSGLPVVLRRRGDAANALAGARAVVHLSDGARFPSFVIAALAAGVPTCATATEVNRELLDGASSLVAEADAERMSAAIEELWEDEARRALLVAAGRARAGDFTPEVAARSYAALYATVDFRRVLA
jgi:glycosyltransferase involved in cell wall biosynthesis